MRPHPAPGAQRRVGNVAFMPNELGSGSASLLCLSCQRRANFTMTQHEFASSGTRAFPMIPRTRFLITAALVCHLLFAHRASYQPVAFGGEFVCWLPKLPNIPTALQSEDITISAVTQEKDGPVIKLHGKVEIHDGTLRSSCRRSDVQHRNTRRHCGRPCGARRQPSTMSISQASHAHLQLPDGNRAFRASAGNHRHSHRRGPSDFDFFQPVHSPGKAGSRNRPRPLRGVRRNKSPPANCPIPSGSFKRVKSQWRSAEMRKFTTAIFG